jgi:hypothetical protein
MKNETRSMPDFELMLMMLSLKLLDLTQVWWDLNWRSFLSTWQIKTRDKSAKDPDIGGELRHV